jgi:hypothetical protein
MIRLLKCNVLNHHNLSVQGYNSRSDNNVHSSLHNKMNCSLPVDNSDFQQRSRNHLLHLVALNAMRFLPAHSVPGEHISDLAINIIEPICVLSVILIEYTSNDMEIVEQSRNNVFRMTVPGGRCKFKPSSSLFIHAYDGEDRTWGDT